jgi:hypothetical protein
MVAFRPPAVTAAYLGTARSRDGAFDHVCSAFRLHHLALDAKTQTLREVRRVYHAIAPMAPKAARPRARPAARGRPRS